jgi:hypothetical protein
MLTTRSTSRAVRLAPLVLVALLLASLLPLGSSGAFAQTLAAAPPEITLESDAVTVTGVTPGGSIAWILLTRQHYGYYPVTRYGAEILVDDDGDGALRIEPPDGIPAMALFLAVDLTTGEGSWLTPEGFEPRVLDLPSQALARGAGGRLNRLTRAGSLYHAVWVRPGPEPGVWQLLADDGGEEDDDGATDGAVRFTVDRLRPVGDSSAAPEQPAAGDLLIVMEPRSFEVAVLALSATAGSGGN